MYTIETCDKITFVKLPYVTDSEKVDYLYIAKYEGEHHTHFPYRNELRDKLFRDKVFEISAVEKEYYGECNDIIRFTPTIFKDYKYTQVFKKIMRETSCAIFFVGEEVSYHVDEFRNNIFNSLGDYFDIDHVYFEDMENISNHHPQFRLIGKKTVNDIPEEILKISEHISETLQNVTNLDKDVLSPSFLTNTKVDRVTFERVPYYTSGGHPDFLYVSRDLHTVYPDTFKAGDVFTINNVSSWYTNNAITLIFKRTEAVDIDTPKCFELIKKLGPVFFLDKKYILDRDNIFQNRLGASFEIEVSELSNYQAHDVFKLIGYKFKHDVEVNSPLYLSASILKSRTKDERWNGQYMYDCESGKMIPYGLEMPYIPGYADTFKGGFKHFKYSLTPEQKKAIGAVLEYGKNRLEEREKMSLLRLKDIKFSGDRTIAFWEDGTKTIVQMQDDEKNYDPEKAIMACYMKKALEIQREYKASCRITSMDRIFDKYLKKYEEEKQEIQAQLQKIKQRKAKKAGREFPRE